MIYYVELAPVITNNFIDLQVLVNSQVPKDYFSLQLYVYCLLPPIPLGVLGQVHKGVTVISLGVLVVIFTIPS